MLYPIALLSIILLALIHLTHALPPDTIPQSTRHHWLRQTLSILPLLSSTPCPLAAFGTVIVNHTATSPSHPHGKLICVAVNQGEETGNPVLHGEMVGILNCTEVMRRDGLSPREVRGSWGMLTLYSSAEPCVMCAAAIRWTSFKECIYGTTVETLIEKGWSQFSLSAAEVFERSSALPSETRLLGGVLANETDPWFSWQFNGSYPCPGGCEREKDSGRCRSVREGRDEL